MYQNQYYKNWGATYYFGTDGSRYTNQFLTTDEGTSYFDNDGIRFENRFYSNWGELYYFGSDGQLFVNKFYSNWGNLYYFGDAGIRYTNKFYSNWGALYYFGQDGARYTNKFYSNWGGMYYFGSDGVRYTNKFYTNWGKIYYFGDDGVRATNKSVNLGFGNIFFNGDGELAYSGNSFLSSIVNAAVLGWSKYGVLPSLTLSQAIIESGWGNSTLASVYHNLFGIKGSYNGQSANMATGEYLNGSYVTVNAGFRAYPTNDASVLDHALFLTQNSRYSNLLWDKSFVSVTTKIRQDGYATSPTYTSTLQNTINTYHLNLFDQLGFVL
ncbi:muramidase [Paucilactobacillus nenjiangensis]|uniref:Muramidase n=2 Tax=Paucilactobacillus nenjiangensis TaxID=1296540 RepID=A0A5P1X368_9LACO|nr:muramidase [Paucilactobacillus nenjiangensis]